ncbi:MAG: hypothetical protein AAF334_01150 [Pseudomonadota bacterium]
MSITSEFTASPQVWIMTHTYLVLQGNNPAGPNFNTGSQYVRFTDANTGPGTCFLESASWFSLDRFKAFLLTADPNSDNSHALPNDVNFFLTADMHGCQFLAYGADRNNLTVEHNNYFANPANYAVQHAAINGGGHNVMIALRPANVAAPAADQYNFPMGANVVGVRKADGWHFYVRVSTTQAYGGTREL